MAVTRPAGGVRRAQAVRIDDAYANLVLPHAARATRLTGRDAAFATELASGTLRRQGTYDADHRRLPDRGW